MTGPVAVLALGGTISMKGSGGVVPTLGADELLAAVPALADGPPVRPSSPMTKPGADLTLADVDTVAGLVTAELEAGATGAVVIQGTDTIEETAFALDLALDAVDRPVVVTGAMRNATLPGPDGPANIFAAVRCAASPRLQGLGVVVVMNDTIHAAVRVQKRHASMMHAFESTPHGPIGWVQEGEPVVVDRTRMRFELPPPVSASARVASIEMCLDPDPSVVEAVLGTEPDGVVVAGFGVGHVPAWAAGPLIEAAASIPVVLASRTGGGAVHRSTYGFTGSERRLLEGGLISAGVLDARKARILLVRAVRSGVDDVASVFAPAVPGAGL